MADNATVIKLQRWSPTTCDCVIEQEVEYDNTLVPGMVIKDPQFHLLNRVCEKHAPLASTEVGPKHAILSPRTMQIIEATKARNLKQVDDLLADPKLRILDREDLLRCREQVLAHNTRITREWEELVTLPHAFDVHIHDQILKENGR